MNKGIIPATQEGGTVIKYELKSFDIKRDFTELLNHTKNFSHFHKPPTQVMKEFLDAHFETEEEKMKAIEYYMNNIVPKLAEGLL